MMTWREIFRWAIVRILRGSPANYSKHMTGNITEPQAIYLDPPRSISEYIAETEGRENKMHRAGVEKLTPYAPTEGD